MDSNDRPPVPQAAAFLGAFVLPLANASLDKAGATFAVSILSLIGFLAAKFTLPEVYGYVEAEKKPTCIEDGAERIQADARAAHPRDLLYHGADCHIGFPFDAPLPQPTRR
ncbi:hypothetical protein [Bradyrhizobium erythrophlei]|uniref:Uncharacterized protein n=1 Tax=Bradyrhizobium erythrophlei TaxID=1437360 RepID=A0A1H4XGB9_9BRAD|nr:hypothetical protein [Bradyrhizobium erythrophlei]SED04709.1 hypothetical protein SAMN05444164_3522 [Bradyrhizobium erythrophlei]